MKNYLKEIQGINRTQLILDVLKEIDYLKGYKEIDEKNIHYYIIFFLYLYFKEGNPRKAEYFHDEAVELNGCFENSLDMDPLYYGLDILEYEYTHFSVDRIYKNIQ